jgi:hypothetical protein
MQKRNFVAIFIFAALSAGCAAQMLSDERLRANTAGALGTLPDDLTISNRTEQVPNTYYTVTTKAGAEYSCIINGGGILAAGMVNPPQCTKKGETPKPYNPLQR